MDRKKGYLFLFLSTLNFGGMAILVKSLSSDLSPYQIAFWRSLIVFITILILLKWRPTSLNSFFHGINPSKPGHFREIALIFKEPILILRGLFGAFALVFYYSAISLIHVSEAVMISYSFPVFTVIFSFFFLKESLRVSSILYILMAVAGVVFITKPTLESFNQGELYGILTAFFMAAAIITIKKANNHYPPWLIVFAFMFFSLVLTSYEMITQFTPLTLSMFGIIMGISITTFFGQFYLTYGLKYIEATTGSIIILLTVVNVTLLSIIFLSEFPDVYSLIGGMFILFASIKLTLKKSSLQLKKDRPTPSRPRF